MDLSNKRVLFIIAPKDFRDEELLEPKKVLESYKVRIIIANNTGTISRGMLGARVEPSTTIEKVDVNDYDAVIFVGGSGSTVYWEDKTALKITKESFLKGKIVCSICLASGTLANAGVFSGKKATGWPDTRVLIEKNGGTYTGKDVEISSRVISALGPKAATKFGEEIAKALGKEVNEE